eukprot:TRINITY_DN7198_c0_g8_i1.p1 TRINITY_DN7198_c0_g8~~TRINITY_DN7198_c0_g8_i1.p1  ORF type:complete len:812 (+),score=171.71 TRINITY_DN7198_c0_g8_i1:268-2703(+)
MMEIFTHGNIEDKFLVLFFSQMGIISIEFITGISFLMLFEATAILLILHKLQGSSYRYVPSNFYAKHKTFIAKMCILCLVTAVLLNKPEIMKAFLLIILVISIYCNKEEVSQVSTRETCFRTHSFTRCPIYRKSSLSQVLNDNDKWLDLLDQGYFLCNKHLQLIYTNKRGEDFMDTSERNFKAFIEQLVETQEANLTLKAIIEKLAKDGEPVKVELSSIEKKEGPLCSGDLLCNYKARVYKLNSELILAIINKKSRFATLSLSRSIRHAGLSTLSHELKTVLNAIMGNLYLLEDSIEKSNVCVYNVALSSAHIFSNKLNDLFDYIQIQEGEFKIHPKEFAIEKLANDINSICKWFAQQKGLNFSILVEPRVPAIVRGDESRIMQMLLNLLTKSIEHTDFGQVTLKAKLTRQRLVSFQVNAIGTGTHSTILTEISRFSPRARKEQYKSLVDDPRQATENMEYMDLAIAKVIAEAIGAKIKFSIKGRGHSRLALVLPKGFPEGALVVQNPPRLVGKAVSQNDFIKRKIDEEILYGKKAVASKDLTPIMEEFSKTRIMSRAEDELDYLEGEIPSECTLPEKVLRGEYKFRVNSMPSAERKEVRSLIQLRPASYREQAENVMNSKDEITKSENMTRLLNNRREKKRRTTMQEDMKAPLLRFTTAKCIEDFSSCSILVADDNMSNRFILKALLKKYGYNSIEAQNGSDAVNIVTKYINSGTIKDLLLIYMDLQMPIMNGIEATRAIIEQCASAGVSSPPIVGVTANSLEEDRFKFEQAGISEFISKPVDKVKINETISRFIKRGCFCRFCCYDNIL